MIDVLNNRKNVLFFIAVALGVLTIWIPPHLPLTDYPQHVGQLSLLKDLLSGHSKWSEIVTINYFTPNLVVYILGLLLSLFFSVTVAFKILISIGYLAFVFACIKLRQYLKVDNRLDWLFILPFFGYAYKWGFITFVISVPIALAFILFSIKYAENPSIKGGIILTALGIVLLESHGLLFLFTIGVGGMILLAHAKTVKSSLLSLIPYLFIFSIFVILFKFNSEFNNQLNQTEYSLNHSNVFEWGLSLIRFAQLFIYTTAKYSTNPAIIVYILAGIIILITPWLLGLRPNIKNKAAFIFFGLITVCFLMVPKYFLGTYMIYQRFAIFFIPSYALLFGAGVLNQVPVNNKTNLIQKISFNSLIIITFIALGFQSYTNFQFKEETKEIDRMISDLEPNQRAFFVIVDAYSDSDKNDYVYWHYPLWYQVDKKGFVEQNFATLAPFPVRYNPNYEDTYAKNKTELTELNSLDENGRIKVNLNKYRYIFIRNDEKKPRQNVFDNYDCKPEINSSSGQWTIYDTKNCNL